MKRKSLLILTAIVVLFTSKGIGEKSENGTKTLVLRCGSGRVFRVDIENSNVTTATLFEYSRNYMMAPNGWFILQDKEGKWFRGNIYKPKQLNGIKLSEGLYLSPYHTALSNNGDKLASCWEKTLRIYNLQAGVAYNAAEVRGMGERVSYPAWSPDDSQIAFYLAHGAHVETLMTLQVTGKLTKAKEVAPPSKSQVSMAGGRVHPPSWSPDGKRIIFEGSIRVRYQKGFDPWILVVDSDGENLSRFYWGKWSPDGKHLFSFVTEGSPEGQRTISVTIDVATGEKTKLKGILPENCHKPEYSSDGTLLAVLTYDYELLIMDVTSGAIHKVPGIDFKNYDANIYWVELPKNQSPPKEEEKRKPEEEEKKLPKRQKSVQEDTNWPIPGLITAAVILAGIVIFLLHRRKK